MSSAIEDVAPPACPAPAAPAERVSIVGLGRVGAPMAACLASRGFEVVGVDRDPRRVADVNEGRALSLEPGHAEALAASGGRLRATTDVAEAVRATDATILLVATPSDPSGGYSLADVLPACEAIGRALAQKAGWHRVVLASTVMPGDTDGRVRPALERASGRVCGRDFGLCYSPVFVALGDVVGTYLRPDVVLVGASDERAARETEAFARRAFEGAPPVARTSLVTAELAKISLAALVTAKISLANLLARICERLPGADVDAITSALSSDRRVGRGAFRGGLAYGGPCFPRDNAALAAVARGLGVPDDLPVATDRFNRGQNRWLVERVAALVPPGSEVAILGIGYKPGSEVTTEAAGLALTLGLVARGIRVAVADPAALPESTPELPAVVRVAASVEACVAPADVVVVAMPWPALAATPLEVFARAGTPRTVVDASRALPGLATRPGVRYVALGRGPAGESGPPTC